MAERSGFGEASGRYEAWRAKRIQLLADDVSAKYASMADSPWRLARGAYHRFATRFGALVPELAGAPVVVSAGDLTPEAFGSWRDRVGRLVWGVSALEEADLLPYTADLVRLASTVLLAIDAGRLSIDPGPAVGAILAGWSERIGARRPRPFVLGTEHADLYATQAPRLRDPVSFAAEVEALAPFERALPKAASRMLASVTPAEDFRPRLKRAPTAFSHLGARRILAVGELDGGQLVREVVQIPGPVSMWDTPKRMQVAGLAAAIDAGRGAAAEPSRRQSRKWLVRGIDGAFAPLELSLDVADPATLLAKMGAEAANVQLTVVAGAATRKAIRRDAGQRPEGWLERAARTVVEATQEDHAEWAARVADRGPGLDVELEPDADED